MTTRVDGSWKLQWTIVALAAVVLGAPNTALGEASDAHLERPYDPSLPGAYFTFHQGVDTAFIPALFGVGIPAAATSLGVTIIGPLRGGSGADGVGSLFQARSTLHGIGVPLMALSSVGGGIAIHHDPGLILMHGGFTLGNVWVTRPYGVVGGYGAMAVLGSPDGVTWAGAELRFEALGTNMLDEVIDAYLPSVNFVLMMR